MQRPFVVWSGNYFFLGCFFAGAVVVTAAGAGDAVFLGDDALL